MQALEPAASRYRHSLLRQAVRLLMGAWGTPAALGVQAPGVGEGRCGRVERRHGAPHTC